MSKKLRNWGVEKPQNTEPKKVSSPAKKNTRRWCRGKEGVEHVPALFLDAQWGLGKPCRWMLSYYSDERFKWRCNHRRRCTVCGKVLQESLKGTECPDLRPGPTKPLTCVRCPHRESDHNAPYRWWNSACSQCTCRSFYWEEQV